LYIEGDTILSYVVADTTVNSPPPLLLFLLLVSLTSLLLHHLGGEIFYVNINLLNVRGPVIIVGEFEG